MPIFNKEISNAEKQQIKIIPKSSVVYANGTTKYNTVFLRINGYCKECYAYTRKQELSYCITIKQNPIGLDINFTEAFVSRKKDHSHQAISRIQNENDNQKQISADSADQIVQPSTSTKQPQLVQYQIRGKEERENIAKEIILNHNGSAKHYRLALIGRKIENVASEDVYSKIVSEYNNRNNISNNWLDNLLSNSTTMSCTVLSNKFNGYVQQIVVYPVFSLICFMQKQFECLKMTAYEDRILHIDATGGLVNVADRYQHYKKYSRFLTYFCYLKNAKTIDQTNGAVLLSEMTTSIQDVSQLTSFFFKTKFEYEKNNKDKFRFRMIVTDMCWALVHSIIDVLNRETVIEYSKSVFEMASGNMTLNQINSKSWLTSCAATQ
ncbi:unnamed protein product [Brachionus calyciflorus]|uniref:Uncharacterized protein n=1 Tax=Brachionus calyciflorus TaxID=104777 RepID=A0A814PSX2_9BILA|nr:unnamed protein product [Brachionus calyciflorus]